VANLQSEVKNQHFGSSSGTENQKNTIAGIDQIEVNLLHYFV